jgi:hypothetical protein
MCCGLYTPKRVCAKRAMSVQPHPAIKRYCLTVTISSPHVQRYGWSAPAQWHSASIRTRQPQPSWAHVSSVPVSFAIYVTLVCWEPHEPGVRWITTRQDIPPKGIQ